MRVTLCVDALQPQLTGVGRYTWELCTRLPRRSEISSLRFYGRRSLVHDPGILMRQPRPQWYWRQLWRLAAPLGSAVLRSTLVHGPNYFLPLQVRSGIITVHDLSVFRYPESHPAARVFAFERLFASSLARASHVITDSDTIRRELIETFSVSPHRVSVVPLGVDNNFHPITTSDLERDLKHWDLRPGHYGLSVATFEPRKNIRQLIAAWSRLPPAVRNRFPLVLAGGAGWRNQELLEAIARGASDGWLRNLGFVADRDLPKLYAGARLFLYPSSYEGFGLPPIEAMASGVPVVVSNRSCLPEICGEAARYIDPDDDDGFTRVIAESLFDDAWRSATIERGLKRSGQFTWGRCIEGTVAAYNRVAS